MLICAKDENNQSLSKEELRDELFVFFLTGNETIPASITYALYWIHKLPHVKKKLLDELSSEDDLSDVMKLMSFPYLNAICQEILRLYPVFLFTFPRITKVRFELMGVDVKPGTMFLPCIYLAHYNSDIYTNPQQFQPERFIENSYNSYEYLPFGGGNRRCLGETLSIFMMKIIIATILKTSTLTLSSSNSIQLKPRGLVYAPANNIKMKLESFL